MKKLLAEYLNVDENQISSWYKETVHDLSIVPSSIGLVNTVEGTIHEPSYVAFIYGVKHHIYLEDLLEFLYSRK